MSQNLRIDPLEMYKKMETAADYQELAIAIAEGVSKIDLSDLASKEDFAELKAEIADLRMGLTGTRTELKAEIADMRVSLTDTRTELKAEITDMRVSLTDTCTELNRDITEVKTELTKAMSNQIMWFTGMQIATIGIMTGILALLLSGHI